MADETSTQPPMLQELMAEVLRQSLDKDLEPPFTVEMTDQAGFVTAARYDHDNEPALSGEIQAANDLLGDNPDTLRRPPSVGRPST